MSVNEELTAAQRRQLDHLRALEDSGEHVGGWKIGLTSGSARDRFGTGVRPFAYILASRILADGDSLSWSEVANGGLENEVCFEIGADITAPVTAASVRDMLAGVAPGFEINQNRPGAAASPAALIEDGLTNWGIVVGPMRPIAAAGDLQDITVTLGREGREIEQVNALGHIDDHFESLATLANQLLVFGRRLQRGDKVITGAFGRKRQPEPGTWTGSFGPRLGTVHLRIEA